MFVNLSDNRIQMISILTFFLGLQAMDKISINKVYDRYFIRKEIMQFEEFHIAFIDLCK
jgi:hypothetical protein